MKWYIITGLGGSGTRILGNIFSLLGFDLGNDLNVAYDNLTIARDFGYYKTKVDIPTEYAEFKKVLMGAVGSSYVNDITRALKSPNLMYFLPFLKKLSVEVGIELHFIHIVRDGLYMINNKNQNQFGRWGDYFPLKEKKLEYRRLEFWFLANQKAILEFKELDLPFTVVYYEDIISSPEESVGDIVNAIGCLYDADIFTDLIENIKAFKPASQKENLEKLPKHLQQLAVSRF